MTIETIFCPSCQHKLRVPEELMGQPVQCPQCQATFTAPPPPAQAPVQRRADFDADGQRTPVRGIYETEPEPGRADPSAARRPFVPGLLLLCIAALGALANIFKIVVITMMPNLLKQFEAALPFKQQPGQDTTILNIALGVVFLLVSLTVGAGAVAMMTRRFYPLAVVGSLAAIANFSECCCLLGAPIGIWALIVLFQPDVRASFR